MSFDSSLAFVSLEDFQAWHNMNFAHDNTHHATLLRGCFTYYRSRQEQVTRQQQSIEQSIIEGKKNALRIGHYGMVFRDYLHGQRVCFTTAGRFGVFPRL